LHGWRRGLHRCSWEVRGRVGKVVGHGLDGRIVTRVSIVRCTSYLVLEDARIRWQWLVVVVAYDRHPRAMRHCFLEDDISYLENPETSRVVDTVPAPSHVTHHLSLPTLLP
jgi:hypothetical protein